jgi:hypothetical protein
MGKYFLLKLGSTGTTSSMTTSSEILPLITSFPPTFSPSARNFTLIPSFEKLNNLTKENIQQLLNILESNADISSCLSNCSNQGICKLSTNQTYICECNTNFMGKSCQTDERPCSQSNKCLSNGTCINSLDLTSFTCQCPENSPYYGQYCENVINLCENVTCSFHGYCIQNQNFSFITQCKCYTGYTGENCEKDSSTVKVVKNVQWFSTAICIVTLVMLWLSFICSDILDFLKIGHEHIDMNKWRHEKIYGEDRNELKA